jgi:hypothetical protein
MGGSHEAAGHEEVATGTVTHGHSGNYDKNKLVSQCCGSVIFWYGSGSEDSVPLTNGSRKEKILGKFFPYLLPQED